MYANATNTNYANTNYKSLALFEFAAPAPLDNFTLINNKNIN